MSYDDGEEPQDTARAAGARFDEEMRRVAEGLQAADRSARALSAAVGGGLRRAMDEAVFGTGKFSDILRAMARDVARGALGAAVAPVQAAVGQGVGALVNGAVGALTGGVRAFARGGVVSGATAFPLAGGVGVAGEAGPEAILPLARGADGRLGVRGGGGARVTVNVTTQDAESFQRSAPQIAAALARAIDRGRRNL